MLTCETVFIGPRKRWFNECSELGPIRLLKINESSANMGKTGGIPYTNSCFD